MPSKYKIHYVTLESRRIYNYVGPWDWKDSDWRKSRRQYLFDRKKDWYLELEQDILTNGFQNPICIVNQLPKNDWMSIPEYGQKLGLICNWVGGSRLFWAQKHNLDIPCLVSDFTGKFKDLPEIRHLNQLNQYFKTPPNRVVFTRWGLDIRDIPGIEN